MAELRDNYLQVDLNRGPAGKNQSGAEVVSRIEIGFCLFQRICTSFSHNPHPYAAAQQSRTPRLPINLTGAPRQAVLPVFRFTSPARGITTSHSLHPRSLPPLPGRAQLPATPITRANSSISRRARSYRLEHVL